MKLPRFLQPGTNPHLKRDSSIGCHEWCTLHGDRQDLCVKMREAHSAQTKAGMALAKKLAAHRLSCVTQNKSQWQDNLGSIILR